MPSRRRVARRFLVLLVVGVPPWTVLRWTDPGGTTGYDSYFVYGLGSLFGPVGQHFTTITTYVSEAVIGPYWHQAWPTASFLYACALGSAALAFVGREDRRVTASLLVMAGALSFLHAGGFTVTNPRLTGVLPLGALLCWTVAALAYRDALSRLVFARP